MNLSKTCVHYWVRVQRPYIDAVKIDPEKAVFLARCLHCGEPMNEETREYLNCLSTAEAKEEMESTKQQSGLEKFWNSITRRKET